MAAYTCDLSTWEVEAGLEIKSHPWLHSEFEATLGRRIVPVSRKERRWRDAQWLRAVAALVDNPGSVLITHMTAHNRYITPIPEDLRSSSKGIPFMHTYTGIHIHKNKS